MQSSPRAPPAVSLYLYHISGSDSSSLSCCRSASSLLRLRTFAATVCPRSNDTLIHQWDQHYLPPPAILAHKTPVLLSRCRLRISRCRLRAASIAIGSTASRSLITQLPLPARRVGGDLSSLHISPPRQQFTCIPRIVQLPNSASNQTQPIPRIQSRAPSRTRLSCLWSSVPSFCLLFRRSDEAGFHPIVALVNDAVQVGQLSQQQQRRACRAVSQ